MNDLTKPIAAVALSTFLIFFNNGCWKTAQLVIEKHYQTIEKPVKEGPKSIFDLGPLIIPAPPQNQSYETPKKNLDFNVKL